MSAGSCIDPSQLCQIEIEVADVSRALAFYEQVFGWQAVPAEMHRYTVLDVPKDCPFGISLIPSASTRTAKAAVTLYFAVDNPREVIGRAVASGGQKRIGPNEVSGYGEIWQFEDLDGIKWGLFRKS